MPGRIGNSKGGSCNESDTATLVQSMTSEELEAAQSLFDSQVDGRTSAWNILCYAKSRWSHHEPSVWKAKPSYYKTALLNKTAEMDSACQCFHPKFPGASLAMESIGKLGKENPMLAIQRGSVCTYIQQLCRNTLQELDRFAREERYNRGELPLAYNDQEKEMELLTAYCKAEYKRACAAKKLRDEQHSQGLIKKIPEGCSAKERGFSMDWATAANTSASNAANNYTSNSCNTIQEANTRKSTNNPLPAIHQRHAAKTRAHIDFVLSRISRLEKMRHEEPDQSLCFDERERAIGKAQIRLDKVSKKLQASLLCFEEDYEGLSLCHTVKAPDGTQNHNTRKAQFNMLASMKEECQEATRIMYDYKVLKKGYNYNDDPEEDEYNITAFFEKEADLAARGMNRNSGPTAGDEGQEDEDMTEGDVWDNRAAESQGREIISEAEKIRRADYAKLHNEAQDLISKNQTRIKRCTNASALTDDLIQKNNLARIIGQLTNRNTALSRYSPKYPTPEQESYRKMVLAGTICTNNVNGHAADRLFGLSLGSAKSSNDLATT